MSDTVLPESDGEGICPTTQNDPYAYLERGEFSSENFKIEIKNLPKFYGISEFRKLLNDKLKLSSCKIKTPKRNSPYAFVCFRNETDREKAIKVIREYKWKGNQLHAIKAKPSADPLVKKRTESSEEDHINKKLKTEQLSSQEKIRLSTIPLSDLDYDKQLELKQCEIKKILQRLGNDLAHYNVELRKWIENQKSKYNGLPCELLDIRYTTEHEGYRNKCEFTIGINQETKLPTVGFRIGAYVDGITDVGPVQDLKHIPESMKIAVKVFEEFVRNSSLQVFNPELQTGHFRQLCARSAPGQLMIIVGIHPQDLTEDQIKQFKTDLIKYFSEGGGKVANIVSLYYQEIVKKNPGEHPTAATHLWGETHIYETILGLKFRISPEAFFQVNTKAAEILYESAIELAEPTEESTVLDICCGTGTIGLCFAKRCSQVLGIEVVPQAIIDARENASMNKIENSEFVSGKAEDIIGSICFKAANDDVIAIADPPRAGLHQKAILQIRKIKKISTLVYISCNPKLALKNFVDLGRPESKTLHGDALVPVKAVAVDLFPHTKHCELILCFKRWSQVQKDMTIEPLSSCSEK